MDYDPEVTHILEVNLTYANLEVITARNGVEALIKASTETPDIILLGDAFPDLDSLEICRRLKESPQTSHIPVIIISAESQSEKRTAKTVGEPDHYITKPFDPKEVVALVKAYLKQMERAENINPLTGLPNQTQVDSELTGLIERNKSGAAIYVDVDDLKAFNKVYGYAEGDRAIRLLAEILREAVRLFGNPDDLVGHLGGDNFVVITTTRKARALCRRIIADFDSRIRNLYKDEDLDRGYIEYEGRLGQKEQCPIMCLRAAVVTNQRQTFYHHLEFSETAAEQIDYLRRFPGSNCYFDLRQNGIEPELSLARRGIPDAHRKELKTLQGVLAWVAFLTKELDIPVTAIEDCLDWVESLRVENFTPEQQNTLKTIGENTSQLVRVVNELSDLTRAEWVTGDTVIEEVNLRHTIDWIMEQVQELAEQRRIEVDIDGVEGIGRITVDGRGLTQGLFYVLRSEIMSSVPGDRLHMLVSEKSKGFITIELINRNHDIPHQELAMLFQGQMESMLASGQRNDLYLAKVLLQGLGGKLSIESKEGEGTAFTISVPKRWQSSMDEVNALLSAAETSRKEARAQLEKIRRLLLSTVEQMPPAIKESLEHLRYKVQELLVLCNRSLFLADDLNSRLEAQQDRLLQQCVEQLATSEAILIVNREIAKAMHMGYLFDLEGAQRVAKNALTIANEFRLSRSEQQALHHAALLKDLGLILSPEDMVDQMVVPTLEKAAALRVRFNLVWKALSQIDFLTPSLVFISNRYERYDGTGCPFGVRGTNIPLGARILAVADTFDSMTSGLSPRGTLAPSTAVQKLVADSGHRFDPDVVSAFLRAWRSKGVHLASIKS